MQIGAQNSRVIDHLCIRDSGVQIDSDRPKFGLKTELLQRCVATPQRTTYQRNRSSRSLIIHLIKISLTKILSLVLAPGLSGRRTDCISCGWIVHRIVCSVRFQLDSKRLIGSQIVSKICLPIWNLWALAQISFWSVLRSFLLLLGDRSAFWASNRNHLGH